MNVGNSKGNRLMLVCIIVVVILCAWWYDHYRLGQKLIRMRQDRENTEQIITRQADVIDSYHEANPVIVEPEDYPDIPVPPE